MTVMLAVIQILPLRSLFNELIAIPSPIRVITLDIDHKTCPLPLLTRLIMSAEFCCFPVSVYMFELQHTHTTSDN